MFRFLEASLASEHGALDGVLVSDVGKPIQIQSHVRTGGVIRTALRASDILMDRVWQLENETFTDTRSFVFARITDVVEPHDDATALHPEIQTERLPAYAPEINPDELVWSWTKYGRLANLAAGNTDWLFDHVIEALHYLRSDPEKLASFIEHTKLPLQL